MARERWRLEGPLRKSAVVDLISDMVNKEDAPGPNS